MEVDDPEDPVLLRVHAKRLISRDIDQLLGICEFALQDGQQLMGGPFLFAHSGREGATASGNSHQQRWVGSESSPD